uniref:Uncharacterized protein n=1 Tax=Meloidogyne javanica TaxID=6303 RepID=A0A915LQP1_MELJA
MSKQQNILQLDTNTKRSINSSEAASYRQHVLHVNAAVHRGCCGLLRHIVSGGQSRSWGVGSEKVTSEARSEKRSEASPESEGAGSEFEGAPVPVPIYLVGPVE